MLYNLLAKRDQWHNKDEILSHFNKGNESLSNIEEFGPESIAQSCKCSLKNFLHNDK